MVRKRMNEGEVEVALAHNLIDCNISLKLYWDAVRTQEMKSDSYVHSTQRNPEGQIFA